MTQNFQNFLKKQSFSYNWRRSFILKKTFFSVIFKIAHHILLCFACEFEKKNCVHFEQLKCFSIKKIIKMNSIVVLKAFRSRYFQDTIESMQIGWNFSDGDSEVLSFMFCAAIAAHTQFDFAIFREQQPSSNKHIRPKWYHWKW